MTCYDTSTGFLPRTSFLFPFVCSLWYLEFLNTYLPTLPMKSPEFPSYRGQSQVRNLYWLLLLLLLILLSLLSIIITKPVDIYFRTLWLATQARDILHYPLVCKTQWTRARVIAFPAEFWLMKFIYLSLAIHWLGKY